MRKLSVVLICKVIILVLSTMLLSSCATTFIPRIDGVTFTESKYLSTRLIPQRLQIYYGARENDRKWSIISSYYVGNDWIFYERIQLVNGDSDWLAIDIDYFDKKTTVMSGGTVRESSDDFLSMRTGKNYLTCLTEQCQLR
jgi:hypothetical protein